MARRFRSVFLAVLFGLLMMAGTAAAVTPTPPYSNADCLECHSVASGVSTHTPDFSAADVSLEACAKCHGAVGGWSGHYHSLNIGRQCSRCHGEWYVPLVVAVPTYTDAVAGSFVSSASLSVTPDQLHAIHSKASWPVVMGVDYQTVQVAGIDCASCHQPVSCSACHQPPVPHASHAATAYPGVSYTQSTGYASEVSTATCVDPACHSLSAAGTAGFVPSCGSCHPQRVDVHGYESVVHTADFSAGLDPSGKSCDACHDAELLPEHQRDTSSSNASGCSTCHPSARSTFGTWTGACQQGGCHEPGTLQERHAGQALDHVPSANAALCSTCHPGDLGSVHANAVSSTDPTKTSCNVCHSASSIPTTNDCTACHFTFDAHYSSELHTSSWTLGATCTGIGCHSGSGDLLQVHSEKNAAFTCASCHDSARPEVVSAISAGATGCGDCHAGVTQASGHRAQHWASPLLTDGAGAHYSYYVGSVGATPTSDCTGCHSSNLVDEHVGVIDAATGAVERAPRTDSTGAVLTCASCHGSVDPAVISAIATGSSRCESCHVVHGPISSVHASTFVASTDVKCSGCHASNLEAEHATRSTVTADGRTLSGCSLCHSNTAGARGATIQDAISVSNDTRCSACHATDHPDLGSHSTSSTASVGGCGNCHGDGSGTLELKALHGSSAQGKCAVCHDNTARVGDITTRSADCASCHASLSASVSAHAGYTAAHKSTQNDCSGSGCHAIDDLAQLHSNAATMVAGESLSGCGVCHRSATSQPSSSDCYSCHAGHGDLSAKHTAVASGECVACHEVADVRTIHSGGCSTCHGSSKVPVLPSGAECVNCHASYSPAPDGHYPAASHVASETGCSACHYLEMNPEHAKASSGAVTCVQCHETKVDTLVGPWDKTCAACHDAKHTAQAAKHTSTRTECGGSTCHNVSDVSDVHKGLVGGGCKTCHASRDALPTTTDCVAAGCHANMGIDHHASHDTSAVVDAGCYGCHYRYLDDEHASLGYTCATCHASSNSAVKAAIASGSVSCDSCHPAVNGRNRHAAQKSYEFITGNSSMHRADSSLPGATTAFAVNGATYNWSLPTTSSFLKSGWSTDSVVTCNNCHSFSSSASGPHGAAVTVNMDPAFTADWNTATLSNGSFRPSNLICNKCHYGNSNEVHQKGDHDNAYCTDCHTGLPHGWRLPRLLAYTSDPTPYASRRLTGVSLSSHVPNSWSESNCSANCSDHGSSLSAKWPSAVVTFGALSGKVTDASGAPLVGVSVTVSGVATSTGSAGTYSVARMSSGSYAVTYALAGYVTQTKTVTITGSQVTTQDVVLQAEVVSANLALNRPATASSSYGSWYSASKAFDGSTSTYWSSSGSGTQWLRVDLGSSRSVSRFVLDWSSGYYARAYRIETSTDGMNWTSRYSTSYGSGDVTVNLSSAVNARYVRLYCTSSNQYTYRVLELEVR